MRRQWESAAIWWARSVFVWPWGIWTSDFICLWAFKTFCLAGILLPLKYILLRLHLTRWDVSSSPAAKSCINLGVSSFKYPAIVLLNRYIYHFHLLWSALRAATWFCVCLVFTERYHKNIRHADEINRWNVTADNWIQEQKSYKNPNDWLKACVSALPEYRLSDDKRLFSRTILWLGLVSGSLGTTGPEEEAAAAAAACN